MKPTAKGLVLVLSLLLAGSATRAIAQISINTSNAADWKISNGVLSVDWNSGTGHIFSIHWSAFPNQELIDQTNRDSHGPKGFYMDNAGNIGGATTPGFFLDPAGNYVDFWITHQADSTSPFTWSWHDVLFLGDPGVHVYFVLDHGPGNLPSSVGQIQWVFRGDLSQFTNTYSVNSGLNNLGATSVPMPDAVLFGTADKGRNVQDATVDLHGLTLPANFRREFYTKYDFSSYEYLHKAEGVYGANVGAWMVLPSRESLTGGPTKQDLIFTGNLLIMEAYSNHLDNQINFTVPQDAVAHRLYGPFYLHFNALNSPCPNAACLYREAVSSVRPFNHAYDSETPLLNSGYVPSTARGDVAVFVEGAQFARLNKAWAVLSDQNTNFQYSHSANEYWTSLEPFGIARFHNVVPGSYRLSIYELGKWGETRMDGVKVVAHEPTFLLAKFRSENFGFGRPLWTIGTADRSSHEFLHGKITNPVDLDPNYVDRFTSELGTSVQDDREYWGNWNYWADFAATNGGVVYYATPVGTTPATRDLTKWNYNQWQTFNPGLFAGIFNPADDTTDGYKYICPAYVGNCATTTVPDWQVHFTTSEGQQSRGQFVILSVGLADTEANLTASLNGNPLVWPGLGLKNADADVRSGFSGTYQWIAFQWNTSQLNPPGSDNVITLHVDRRQGVMYDALRMEVSKRSAAHEVTGLNDYEYVSSGGYEPANDAVANQQ